MSRCFIFIFISCLLISCNKKQEVPEDVLLRYGDNFLTYSEVMDKMPAGINSADSVAIFDAIVDSWLKTNVLAEFASKQLFDLNVIDRKVNEYRNSLIVLEYLSKMRESRTPKIEEEKIKEYFESHRKELKLEVPVIKGIFIKISSDIKGWEEINKLLSSGKEEDLDKLEQNWMDRVIEYNYFLDKWVDWETVAGLIPHRFNNPDQLLETNKLFEVEYGDCRYILWVPEYLPSGSDQPYEFARYWIANLLSQGELSDYERNLVTSLLNKSIKEEKLEIIGYDPFKHEMITKQR